MPAKFLERLEDISALKDGDPESRHLQEDFIINEFLSALVAQHKLQGVYNIVAKRILAMQAEKVRRWFG